ncbi:MAG: potassium-transporting ATPase subunit KdpC [Oscillospiraceae bacterium]
MKTFKEILPRAAVFFLIFTVICGLIYTALVTGAAQLAFRDKANGSIIEIDGKKYGSELLAQQFTDEAHMWGRIMNLDVSTYKDENGKRVMYAAPSNLSPASDEFEELVAERVAMTRAANPDMDEAAIPVDLVTCSGSGLDPDISPAAADYQVARLAKANSLTEDEIRAIIKENTKGRLLGVFGEETVNVLGVNLAIDRAVKGA